MKRLRKAFSLLELIVVLTVIGVIATFGYSKFTEVMMESKATQLANQLNKIEVGLNNYYAELGTYPLDVKWLVTSEMDKTNASTKDYDSLSLKLNGSEDEDVKNYWSGPYIKDMKTNDDTIQAVFGDKIKVCSEVTGDTLTGASKVPSVIQNCVGKTIEDPTIYINTILIEGVDAEAVKYIFKAINGRDMTDDEKIYGNAYDVANGTGNKSDKLGVPARAEFGKGTPYIIYKFAENIQNN